MKLIIDISDKTYEIIRDMMYFYYPQRSGRAETKEIITAIKNGTPLPKGHGRKFEEIVVQYSPAELCIYPEYKGKPYFSIKYEENGEHFIGFGTYHPEVLSRYLREYFITPTIIEADKEDKE